VRLGLVSRPILASIGLEGFRSRLGLGHKGYRSRSQAYCLETLNIAIIWLGKTSVIQRAFSLLYLHFACKKQPKQVGKMSEIRKSSTHRRWQFFFNIGKIHKFSNVESRNFLRSLVSKF